VLPILFISFLNWCQFDIHFFLVLADRWGASASITCMRFGTTLFGVEGWESAKELLPLASGRLRRGRRVHTR